MLCTLAGSVLEICDTPMFQLAPGPLSNCTRTLWSKSDADVLVLAPLTVPLLPMSMDSDLPVYLSVEYTTSPIL